MTNKELQEKLQEAFEEENFFDMIEKVMQLKEDYKQTSFYKKTKIDFLTIAKEYYDFNRFSAKTWVKKIQIIIDNLDLDNINALMEELTTVFKEENEDVNEQALKIKDLIEELYGAKPDASSLEEDESDEDNIN